MHSMVARELVRQQLDEIDRRVEQLGRRRPSRRRHDERVLRRPRHDAE